MRMATPHRSPSRTGDGIVIMFCSLPSGILAVKSAGSFRLPPHEVERIVTDRLHNFLKSDSELFDGLSSAGESPAVIQPLVAAAKKLATRWLLLRSDELRDHLYVFRQASGHSRERHSDPNK